jgi:hypothetical protein
MSNKIKLLMGYTISDNKNVSWGDGDIITEVQTEGEDFNGYPLQETLGIAKNEYGDLCIFRGSTDREVYERCTAITMSESEKSLSVVLYELAHKLDDEGY